MIELSIKQELENRTTVIVGNSVILLNDRVKSVLLLPKHSESVLIVSGA